ncbi:MAG: hypothetical protein NZ772_05750 [Cyanobacteria bacterium]|nr:hypothetical protein [Cyanobacteriota bacterium]MDW8201026.1 hypothetical protein [Cyanobacteriota bacterium SKYGB_h_bin112]
MYQSTLGFQLPLMPRSSLRTISLLVSLGAMLTTAVFPVLAETACDELPIKGSVQPAKSPLEIEMLARSAEEFGPRPCAQTLTVLRSDTICLDRLTVPSLWWTKVQFAEKLVQDWLAYPASSVRSARIDLVVQNASWRQLTYVDRYKFLTQFGTVARQYGYNVRVFNSQGRCLAAYTCDFSAATDTAPRCEVSLTTPGVVVTQTR